VIGKRHSLVNEDLQNPLDIVVDETGPDQRKGGSALSIHNVTLKLIFIVSILLALQIQVFLILLVYLKKDIYLAVLVKDFINSACKQNE
jgi:hypothetical protein